jgi:hypothetical protein
MVQQGGNRCSPAANQSNFQFYPIPNKFLSYTIDIDGQRLFMKMAFNNG